MKRSVARPITGLPSAPSGGRRWHDGLSLQGRLRELLILSCCGVAFSGCRSRDHLPATDSKTYTKFVSAFYTGLAGLQVGDDVRAETDLSRAADLVPGEPAVWINWGVLALRQRNFEGAAERLKRAHQLAPNDDRIDYLLGILESGRGDSTAAIGDLREAVRQNPKNLRAVYRLATEVERQGDTNSDAEVEDLLQQILSVDPENMAALVDLCRVSAKRGDAVTLHAAIERIVKRSEGWSPEVKQQLAALQASAAGPEPRAAATRSTFLRNVLMREPSFRASLAKIAAQPGEETEPVTRFLLMQNPPSRPAPMDAAMSYSSEPVQGMGAGKWDWVGALALNGADAPVVAACDGHHVHLANGVDLPFPGGASGVGPSPEGVLAFDFNYDFKTDLLFAGGGGMRLLKQESATSFVDVTAAMKLPANVPSAAYTGAWAIDVEADGDLDVVLGTKVGAPTVLQNNGDGTFTPIHPFAGVSGIRQFVWADLNGDGSPDVALIDGSGRLRVFANQRVGRFIEAKLPDSLTGVRAVAVSSTNVNSFLRLNVVSDDGKLLELSYQETNGAWTQRELAGASSLPRGEIRLRAGDVDNNGAVDLMVLSVAPGAGAKGAVVWLQDETGAFHGADTLQVPAEVFDAVDVQGNGRLDLLGLNPDGAATVARNHGTKDYHWQTIRPRARQATGDQRINPFGIGGEIEIRSGLLVQKQPMTGPALHFGLGTQKEVDVARIVWPNGSVRAEFGLKADQEIVTEQRLKGSCPFLFAWDGKKMSFVKDSVPWGSAIGLRINALGTADIAATEEWYKISGDELKARDGFYDLRVTGELWETYFYDSLALMTVDHPIGTEVFTDERYDVPAVKLAITAVGEPQPIARAIDDHGADVTDTLRKLDGKYLDTFGRGQYQGVTRDHYVEVDLGEHVPEGVPLWLIAKGWLHPSDSTVNVAMDQGKHERPHWLSMEVPDEHGGWRVVRSNLGFPAGRKKICMIDLSGVFQRGASHRLRLRTNLEVYWDSIEWAKGLPDTPLKINRAAPAVADLHYRGFSAVRQANASSPELPNYDHLASTSRIWRDLAGFYTRFGDVRPLLEKTDDSYVIMNAGDEMSLRFAASDAPPVGWVRDYVLAGDGWIKDGDYNSAYSQNVLPYPHHTRKNYDGPPTSLENDWMYQHHKQDWMTYQTRYVDGSAFRDALVDGGSQ
ncbi:FG-GAP-like repeat-containing protein [Granulicella arctica]|uniref:FG-GAP-like repeat-containing protein n=1 Tax=Granulicella arctica TaxID=940613 RepID=UPI0021DF89C2|nr:FG-GAP-like repeat-containing protein [Granulicella arctica]